MREVFQPIAHMLGSETILHDKYRRLTPSVIYPAKFRYAAADPRT
jgi:hypothetical protein